MLIYTKSNYICKVNKPNIIILVLFLTFIGSARATDFKHPSALDQISEASIFALAQDCTGAVWIGVSNGIYRYNGNGLETISSTPLPFHQFTTNESGRYIYAATQNSFRRFDALTTERYFIRTDGIDCPATSFCARGDSLIVAYRGSILVSHADTLLPVIQTEKEATCITPDRDGSFLVGCSDGSILLTDLETISVKVEGDGKAVHSLMVTNGAIWAGIDGNIIRFSSDFSESGRWEASKNIRTIAVSGKDELFFGSPGGLYKIDKADRIARQDILGSFRTPVFQLISDWNGDIWAGTLENGCLHSNETSFPFERLDMPEGIRSLHGMVRDEDGGIWILTDAFGLFHRTSDGWKVIPGTEDVKYQFCMKDGNRIWTSEYMGELMSLNLKDGTFRTIRQEFAMKENFWAAERVGDDIYVGATGGLYVVNPSMEKTVSRKVPGLDKLVHCIDTDSSGRLWIGCREGIYSYRPGDDGVRKEFEGIQPLEKSYISDILCMKNGMIAAAMLGKGVALYSPEEGMITFRAEDGQLPEDHTVSIAEFDDMLIVGCKGGVAVIDPARKESRIYKGDNSVRFAKDCSFIDRDGCFVFAGTDGIFRLAAGMEIPSRPKMSLCFDHISANGEQVTFPTRLPKMESVTFNHEIRRLSIDVASFNYPEVTPVSLEYLLEGYSYDWIPFDSHLPIEIGNINPGKYTLKVREKDGESISLGIRIRPAWYACMASKVAFTLIAVLTAVLLIQMYFKRKILASELEREKEESRKKTIFFLNLSNNIRTPLNLLIGQIEKYFRNYGTRAPGINDIEEAYADAGRIRSLISDFVDTQNDDPLTDEERQRAADARFLNALTAVIESNLFSEDISTAFLCEKMNMGRTTLTNRLRETTGKTPHEFTEDIRLRHAAEMLQKGNKRVADIASDLRYCSPRYFSDCFRRKFGCNPSEYIEKFICHDNRP